MDVRTSLPQKLQNLFRQEEYYCQLKINTLPLSTNLFFQKSHYHEKNKIQMSLNEDYTLHNLIGGIV
jgi:hypothetical protein